MKHPVRLIIGDLELTSVPCPICYSLKLHQQEGAKCCPTCNGVGHIYIEGRK